MSEEQRGSTETPDEDLEPPEALEDLLIEISEGLGLDADVRVRERDDVLEGRLEGHELGLFIGRHGQTIDAVQHLAQRIVFPDGPAETRIVVVEVLHEVMNECGIHGTSGWTEK